MQEVRECESRGMVNNSLSHELLQRLVHRLQVFNDGAKGIVRRYLEGVQDVLYLNEETIRRCTTAFPLYDTVTMFVDREVFRCALPFFSTKV